MVAPKSSRDKGIMGLPTDVVLTSVIALLIISTVVLGDMGLAANVKTVKIIRIVGTQFYVEAVN